MAATAQRHFVAIDMGSNSFHLMIAREQDGKLQILHKEKEQVRLAQGLSSQGYLCDEAINRALECLKNFNQRFSALCETRVRIVATYTLRAAKNRDKLLNAALSVIPYPIEVISGHEEARLIYSGIAQSQVLEKHNLVIDIGGGSTEVIIGSKHQPTKLSSLRCGCVSYNERFFADGYLTLKAFRSAQASADKQFKSLSKEYFEGRWDLVLGSSGSVKAICEALQALFNDDTVTLPRLRELKLKLVQLGHVDKLDFANIDRKRIPLVPAGLAILISFFKRLGIEKLTATPAALREGVLYELAHIDLGQDIRHRTVDSIAQLYHVDTKHGAKVRDSAMALFDSVADQWNIRPNARLLAYAAMLHEIGIHINSRAHHKHGSYIVANSDLPGFSEDLQQDLALLIAGQHKKPPFDVINGLPEHRRSVLIKLLCLLRLAILINLGRIARSLRLNCSVIGENELKLFPEQSARVELLMKDLKRERKHMAQLGLQLQIDQHSLI